MIEVKVKDDFAKFLANANDWISVLCADNEIIFYQATETISVIYKTKCFCDLKAVFRISKKILQLVSVHNHFCIYPTGDRYSITGIDEFGNQHIELACTVKTEFSSLFNDIDQFYAEPSAVFNVPSICKKLNNSILCCENGVAGISVGNMYVFEMCEAPDYCVSTKYLKMLGDKCWKHKNYLVGGHGNYRVVVTQTVQSDIALDVNEILNTEVGYQCKFNLHDVMVVLNQVKVSKVVLNVVLNFFEMKTDDGMVIRIPANIHDTRSIEEFVKKEIVFTPDVLRIASTMLDLTFTVNKYNYCISGYHGNNKVGCIFK